MLSRGPRWTPRGCCARCGSGAMEPWLLRRPWPSGGPSSRSGSDAGSAEWAARVRASPPAGGRLAGGADRDGGRVVAPVAPRAADVRPARVRRGGGERPAGRPRGGAGPSRRALRAARARAHGQSGPGALRGGGGNRPACGGGAAGGGGGGPRGTAGGPEPHRPGPVRAHARPRGLRTPGAVALRPARGGPGTRQGTRGVGRGGAPAGARACGLRRAAARGAGDDPPARNGRPPGGGARGERAVRVGGPVVPARSEPRGVRAAGAGPGATGRREPDRHPARLSLGRAEEA